MSDAAASFGMRDKRGAPTDGDDGTKNEEQEMKKRQMKPPNPVARTLRRRRYRARRVPSKTVYNRKRLSPLLKDGGDFRMIAR